MKTHREVFWAHPHHDDPEVEPSVQIGQIRLPETVEEAPEPSKGAKMQRILGKAFTFVTVALNPPLIGGILAIFFGIIPWLHRQLFTTAGWLSPYDDLAR